MHAAQMCCSTMPLAVFSWSSCSAVNAAAFRTPVSVAWQMLQAFIWPCPAEGEGEDTKPFSFTTSLQMVPPQRMHQATRKAGKWGCKWGGGGTSAQ